MPSVARTPRALRPAAFRRAPTHTRGCPAIRGRPRTVGQRENDQVPQLTQSLRNEYELRFESCLIRSTKRAEVDRIITKLKGNAMRYQKVGNAVQTPWYVVGLIHVMESSMSFTTHLHNGDPLTARTTHVPAGRPKAGRPPFTWEASAIDALTLRGFEKWADWSVPGILYQLEGYNGWGYHDHHPDVPTPYLWAATNQYSRGKYVADGRFSPTAVSAQCGAAAILKRLVETAPGAVVPGDRVLQLANPSLRGLDVEAAQRLLKKNPFGSFDPGTVDGVYARTTADAVGAAKWALGYPAPAVNGSFGPLLRMFLDGTRPLPADYAKRRAARSKTAAADADTRKRIVQWALWGCKNNAQIGYSSNGSVRLSALEKPGSLPLATDSSAFATLCFRWADAPNPNAAGKYDARRPAYTGSMLAHCRQIPRTAAGVGDLVVWSPPKDGHHVAIVVTAGADPMLVSLADASGPKKVRFSAEDAGQRRSGHGQVTWLTAF
jgi:lysozyme family protein